MTIASNHTIAHPLNTIAVVPAKGTSRRLPAKNRRRLCGKPLFRYAVDAALRGGVREVLVSSDDDRILQLARDAGATPVWRPARLAGDWPDLQAVKRHALVHAGVHWQRALHEDGTGPFDGVLMLLPTYPFRAAADIRRALDLLGSGQVQTIGSGMRLERCGGMVLPNAWLSGELLPHAQRRLGVPAGSIAGIECSAWMQIDRVRGIDIDDAEDWARAEHAWGRFDFFSGFLSASMDRGTGVDRPVGQQAKPA